jgi:hypothetical protein
MSWVITFIALVLAGAASAWALTLRREQAARRAVRVAALSAAIDAPGAPLSAVDIGDDSPWFPAAERAARDGGVARHVEPVVAGASLFAGGEPDDAEHSAAGASLFAEGASPRPRSRFGLALALGALVLVAGLAGATMLAGSGEGREANRNAAAGAEATHPIELVSMTDRTEQSHVTVSGLVRNPHGNATVERLTAVVFFFDGQGGFLASARALADFPRLAGGDETPFVVTAPAPRGASRFRVSFRAGEGGIVPHVDRRGAR